MSSNETPKIYLSSREVGCCTLLQIFPSQRCRVHRRLVVYLISAVILAFCIASCSSSPTDLDTSPDHQVSIQNQTGISITDIYLRPSYNAVWGNNLLSNILHDGEAYILTVNDTISLYDIRLVAENDDTFTKEKISILDAETIIFTENDIDTTMPPDPDPQFTIKNNTGVIIYSVFIKATGQEDWSEDLATLPIPNSGTLEITLNQSLEINNLYDIRLYAGFGHTYTIWSQEIEPDCIVSFTPGDRDESDGNEVEVPDIDSFRYIVYIVYGNPFFNDWESWVFTPVINVHLYIGNTELELINTGFWQGKYELYNADFDGYISGQAYNLTLIVPNNTYSASLQIAHQPTILSVSTNPDSTITVDWQLSQSGDWQELSVRRGTQAPIFRIDLAPTVRSYTIPAGTLPIEPLNFTIEVFTAKIDRQAIFYNKQTDIYTFFP